MSELEVRTKTVIKLTGSCGESLDIELPKGADLLSGLNWALELIGHKERFQLMSKEYISGGDTRPCDTESVPLEVACDVLVSHNIATNPENFTGQLCECDGEEYTIFVAKGNFSNPSEIGGWISWL